MNAKMVQNGFKVNKDNPDLLVLITTSNDIKGNFIDNNVNKYQQVEEANGSVSTSPNYASISTTQYNRYFSKGGEEINNRPYKEGSLIIEMFDRCIRAKMIYACSYNSLTGFPDKFEPPR